MRDNEFTKVLGWPGYRVFRHEIDEIAKTLRLWVRRKRGNCKLICSGCGSKYTDAHDCNVRDVRDAWHREGQTLAAADALDESRQPKTPAVKRAVCPEPARDESLPSEGKLGER